MTEPSPDRDRREAVFVEERPWGRFRQFTANEPTTVKTITVDPGQRLSLQRHQHRAELWHVLAGPWPNAIVIVALTILTVLPVPPCTAWVGESWLCSSGCSRSSASSSCTRAS